MRGEEGGENYLTLVKGGLTKLWLEANGQRRQCDQVALRPRDAASLPSIGAQTSPEGK